MRNPTTGIACCAPAATGQAVLHSARCGTRPRSAPCRRGTVKTANFDLAILDVNLDGEPVLPVADALVARGMPFVFATGYGERGLPELYRDRPTLKKPFQMEGLKQMLQSALDRGNR